MKKEVMVDMTSGRIAPQILKFAMPVLLGLVFQRIYNFADSYIVGHFLGDNALAAVSVAGVGMYLVFSLIIGLTTGVTVVMSQYYGAKEEDKVVKTFFSSIFIALGMTILVTVIGLLNDKTVTDRAADSGRSAGCGCFVPADHLCRFCRNDVVQLDFCSLTLTG